MRDNTSIEWTNATWNPVTGCTQVSPGCDHCYALTFAERFRGVPNHPYEQGFDLKLWSDRLELPLKWKKPRRIFVNSRMVQGINLISQSIANFINVSLGNLYPRSYAGITREFTA